MAIIYLIYALYERVIRPEEKHWVVMALGWLVLLYCAGESFSWFWSLRASRQRLPVLALLLIILISMLSPGPVAWALRQFAVTNSTYTEAVQVVCEKGGKSKSSVQLWDFRLNYSVNGTKYQKYFSNLYNCPGKDKPVVLSVSSLWPAIAEIDWEKTARQNRIDNRRHDQP